MPTDLYDVLGAPADASSEELEGAYRSRVREFHPDVNDHSEADAQFKLIQTAKDVLSDSAERKDYDRMGHREYVEKRLDDPPPLSVFPELESAGRSADSGAAQSPTSARSSERADTTTAGGSQGSRTDSATSQTAGSRERSNVGSTSTDGSASTAGGSTASTTTSRSQRRREQHGESARSAQERSAAGADPQWGDVTGGTATQTRTRRSQSAASRRRRGLRRWYGVVLVALLSYVGGIGAYLSRHSEALGDLVAAVTTAPAPTLLSQFPLPSPTAYVRTATDAMAAGEPGVGVLLLVGTVALPVVVLTAVAQFGQGSAWVYALASLGPPLTLVASPFLAVPTLLSLLGLVLLPLFSGLGFVVDVGRYLYATR
jgi:curved DNA-binding protein CbpA